MSVAATLLVCGYGPDSSGFAAESAHEFHTTESTVYTDITGFPGELNDSKRELAVYARRTESESLGIAAQTREVLHVVRAYAADAPRRLERVSPIRSVAIFAVFFAIISVVRTRKDNHFA